MNRRFILAVVGATLALGGFVGYETHRTRQQDEQLRALRQRAAQLGGEGAALRREREAIAQDLAEAERQLAALPTRRPDAPPVSAEHRAEMRAWLARVKQLRQLFDDRPEQRIPEMQFLTDHDWLRVAKNLRFDSPEDARRAQAAIRDAATSRFTPQLSAALRRFAKAPPSDPTSVLALNDFSDPPIDANLLARYELTQTKEAAPRWRVQTKAPLDPDYDSRHYVDVYVDARGQGGGSMGAPWAWVPDFQGQSMRAYRAYAEANQGATAPSLAEALPYFNPPLSPPLAEKLIEAERKQRR